MTTQTAIPDPPAADPQTMPRRRAGLILYLAIVLLLPAFFLLSAIPIVRSAAFPAEADDPFLLYPDHAFGFRGANCDVVIYGDSTASTGLDPTVVQRDTGLKTCNIAQSRSIFEIFGPRALESYLKNNVAPRYLVIQLAPETISRDKPDFFWPEGLTMVVRRESLPKALLTLARHPVESYHFALWAIQRRIDTLRHGNPDFSTTDAIYRSHDGLLILPKPPETACGQHLGFRPPTPAWVEALRARYQRNGTQVLVNISPVPACSPEAVPLARAVRGVTDNALPVFPIGLFCDLDRHLTLAGAERASAELAAQIRALRTTPSAQ